MAMKVLAYGNFQHDEDGGDELLPAFDGVQVVGAHKGALCVKPFVDSDRLFFVVPVDCSGFLVRESESFAEISIPGLFGSSSVVTVYRPGDSYGQLGPSKVNWSGCGASSPYETERFVQALQLALSLARQYDAAAGLEVA